MIWFVMIKILLLFLIVVLCAILGTEISKKYVERENNLKNFLENIEFIKNKIKYTAEPLESIFEDIYKIDNSCIGRMFYRASKKVRSRRHKNDLG